MKFISAHIKILFLVFVTGIGLSSCKKDGDIAPVVLLTNLNTVNANSNAINIYQNGTRLNNLDYINPGSSSGYLQVAWGTQQYQLKKAGPGTPNYVISDYQLTLDTAKVYSLFVAGETTDKLFLINDAPPVPSDKQAIIRFVNTLPGSVNLDVTIGSSFSQTNMQFKSASKFSYINSGANTIKIYQSGSATPIIDQTVALTNSTIYTIFTTGTLNGTGPDKFTAKLMINQ